MKHAIIRLTILSALLAALMSFSSSVTVHAAGVCLKGVGIDHASSVKIPVNAGDVVVVNMIMDNPDDAGLILIYTDVSLLTGSSGIGAAEISVTMPFSGHVAATFTGFPLSTFDSSFTWQISVNGGCPSGTGPGPLFKDGRLNSGDGAETAAIYCDKGDVIVYYIGQPWQGVLHVTTAEIDRVPSLPAQNTLIKQNAKIGVALYRLTSGELQVNAPGGSDGKGPYSFIFTDCPRDH